MCDYGGELFIEGLGYVCVAGEGGGVKGDGTKFLAAQKSFSIDTLN